jgi:hypothetical protein
MTREQRLTLLRKKLAANTLQIEALVADKHGWSSLDSLTPAEYERVQKLAEQMLDAWEDAAADGDPAVDEDVPFNRLARDRLEILKQLEDEC